jgi:hypothetical protein
VSYITYYNPNKFSEPQSLPPCNTQQPKDFFLEDSDDPFEKQVGGDHYKTMKIQPINYILANNLGFCEANIVKYISRYKQKGGIQDVKKVIHYAEMLLAHLEEQDNGLT